MPDRKVASAYVEITSKGFAKVKDDIDRLKTKLGQVGGKAASSALDKTANTVPPPTPAKSPQARPPNPSLSKSVAESLAREKAQAETLRKQFLLLGVSEQDVSAHSAAYQKAQTQAMAKVKAATKEAAQAAAERAQQIQDAFRGAGEGVTATLTRVGQLASRAFLGGVAGITAFVRAADPVGWSRFTGTLAAISVQIGSIFLPLLDSVSAAMEKLLGWLRNLTPEQKDQILHWTKIGLAIAGTLVFVPKIIGGIRLITNAMAAFGVSSGIATGGLTIILGLLASLLPVLVGMGVAAGDGEGALSGLGEIFNSLKPIFKTFMDAFQTLADAMKPVFDLLVRTAKDYIKMFAAAFQGSAPMIEKAVDAVAQVIKDLVPVVEKFLGRIMPIVQNLLNIIVPIFQELGAKVLSVWLRMGSTIVPKVEAFLNQLADLWEKLAPDIEDAVKAVGEVVMILVDAFADLLPYLVPILDTLGALIPMGATLTRVFVKLAKTLIEVMVPVLGFIKDSFKAMIDWMFVQINDMIDKLNLLIETANKLPGINIPKLEHVQAPGGPAEVKQPEKKEKEKPEEGRHTPQMQQKVEIMSVVDAWKKAQTAVNATDKESGDKERNNLLQQGNKNTEDIGNLLRENNRRQGPAVFAP